jgi:hypothetical protein
VLFDESFMMMRFGLIAAIALLAAGMMLAPVNLRLGEPGWMLLFGMGLIVIARAARRRLTGRSHSG